MSKYKGMVRSTVELTGLPSEIWPFPPPLHRLIDSGQLEFALDDRSTYQINFDTTYYEWIQVHKNTISAISQLPAAHVLGQGVLLRTTPGLTVMVSVAEAAFLILGENVSELIWILIQVIEWELRADAANAPIGHSQFHWKKEISPAEQLKRERQEQERQWQMQREMELERRESQLESQRGMRHGADESSEFIHLTVQQFNERFNKIKQQQETLHKKLNAIQQQNEEIIQLVKGIYRKSNEADKTLPPGPNMASELISDPRKYYRSYSELIGARKKDRQWFICVPKNREEKYMLGFLLDWLEIALGGSGVDTSSRIPTYYIQLEEENKACAARDTLQRSIPKETHSCWRNKILSGNILVPQLEVAIPPGKAGDGFPSGNQGFSHPFSQMEDSQMEDSLILTATALWSLFDNSLERVPNCQCTFRTESNDFIQCKIKSGKWFLWHTFRNEKLCEGYDCGSNIRVALTAEETGE